MNGCSVRSNSSGPPWQVNLASCGGPFTARPGGRWLQLDGNERQELLWKTVCCIWTCPKVNSLEKVIEKRENSPCRIILFL